MTGTSKLTRPEEQDDPGPESILPGPPPPDDKVGAETSPQDLIPPPEPINLSSPKVEFSLRIGSFVGARKSMVVGYLATILAPTVIGLALIALIGVPHSDGDRSLVRSLKYILTVIAVMGLPMMVVSWANGLYPKGSYGRFVSGTALALLLALWLILLFLESDLQDALAGFGMVYRLERVFVLICVLAVFYLGRAISELVDERKLWRRSLGAKVRIVPIDLKSRFLDFHPRIGRLQDGNSCALRAYAKFLIVPTVLLVIVETIPDRLDLADSNALEASIGTMFDVVLLVGVVMVVLRYVRGFYPSGSLGRAVFGLMGVPVMLLLVWGILFVSGLEDALERNRITVDMSSLMLPVLVYVLFTSVSESSELADNRRPWHRKIGLPIAPYVPEERYGPFHDFRFRYACFVAGAGKGRDALNKCVFRRIFAILIVEAILVSTLHYFGNGEATGDIEASISSHVDRVVLMLLLIGTVIASVVFLQWSYRKGSFARLVMSGMVCLFTVLWTYVFWSSVADGMSTVSYMSNVASMLIFVMYVLIAWAGIKALFALWTYFKDRETYLNWRTLMLQGDASYGTAPPTPGVSASVKSFLGNINW